MISELTAVSEIIADVGSHSSRAAQIEVVAGIVGVLSPVHLNLIAVVIGVDVVDSQFLRQVSHEVVDRDVVALRRGRAVKNELDIVALAVIRDLKQHLLVIFVDLGALFAVPVVILFTGIGVMAVVDEEALEILADTSLFPILQPCIVISEDRKFILGVFGHVCFRETFIVFLFEKVVDLKENDLDRLGPPCGPDREIALNRCLPVLSAVVRCIAVVPEQLERRESSGTEAVSDVEDIDLALGFQ